MVHRLSARISMNVASLTADNDEEAIRNFYEDLGTLRDSEGGREHPQATIELVNAEGDVIASDTPGKGKGKGKGGLAGWLSRRVGGRRR